MKHRLRANPSESNRIWIGGRPMQLTSIQEKANSDAEAVLTKNSEPSWVALRSDNPFRPSRCQIIGSDFTAITNVYVPLLEFDEPIIWIGGSLQPDLESAPPQRHGVETRAAPIAIYVQDLPIKA